MKIRLGYDIAFEAPQQVAMVAMLHVHPTRAPDLLEPDVLETNAGVTKEEYVDSFGNLCTRLLAPPGELHLHGATLINDSGEPDAAGPGAVEHPPAELPTETLQFLLASRYCEVDLLSPVAHDLFGGIAPGWPRVQAICGWVHWKVEFGYQFARPTKTALEVYTERRGVCRDFQHLAITFCRAMNIPARYATGYLGDIGIYIPPAPMDFSAWFEVYLGDRWWTLDARHNQPRIGRVLMATGRDAADVALTTAFGAANLKKFFVVSDEVVAAELTKAEATEAGETPA
jgi:transglutaminase-like putative cysteine protease